MCVLLVISNNEGNIKITVIFYIWRYIREKSGDMNVKIIVYSRPSRKDCFHWACAIEATVMMSSVYKTVNFKETDFICRVRVS